MLDKLHLFLHKLPTVYEVAESSWKTRTKKQPKPTSVSLDIFI